MQSAQEQIISEASELLREVYDKYKNEGMNSIYLWGSITRDDFDPQISDVDSLAIIDTKMDLAVRLQILQWLKNEFSRPMKFGLQFYGIEELNGAKTYTLLADLQPPGYLLLRFNDWIYVAGTKYRRDSFKVVNMTPLQAKNHQLAQVKSALSVMAGDVPLDSRRAKEESMHEDVVKGAIGALYWQSVMDGNRAGLNYDQLESVVKDEYKELAHALLEIRASGNYSLEEIKELQPQLEELD